MKLAAEIKVLSLWVEANLWQHSHWNCPPEQGALFCLGTGRVIRVMCEISTASREISQPLVLFLFFQARIETVHWLLSPVLNTLQTTLSSIRLSICVTYRKYIWIKLASFKLKFIQILLIILRYFINFIYYFVLVFYFTDSIIYFQFIIFIIFG